MSIARCRTRAHPRAPLAGTPLLAPLDAIALLTLAAGIPPRPETFAVLLDHAHCGHTILCVDGAASASQVHEVTKVVFPTICGAPSLSACVFGTVRVESPFPSAEDEEAWFDLRCQADDLGIELVDWFLFDAHYSCSMAELTDSRSLWRSDR